jgi:S-adenosylmethionine:tRNA-ribosyltransferase-isomerase (queuine synthetase)
MKLSTSFSIALLSTFASVSNVLGSTYDPNVPDPVCIKLDNINFKSVNAEFVNTDGSPGNQITTGKQSALRIAAAPTCSTRCFDHVVYEQVLVVTTCEPVTHTTAYYILYTSINTFLTTFFLSSK